MARRRIAVAEVRQVIIPVSSGMPIKRISGSLGKAQNTVREFIRHALNLGLRELGMGQLKRLPRRSWKRIKGLVRRKKKLRLF